MRDIIHSTRSSAMHSTRIPFASFLYQQLHQAAGGGEIADDELMQRGRKWAFDNLHDRSCVAAEDCENDDAVGAFLRKTLLNSSREERSEVGWMALAATEVLNGQALHPRCTIELAAAFAVSRRSHMARWTTELAALGELPDSPQQQRADEVEAAIRRAMLRLMQHRDWLGEGASSYTWALHVAWCLMTDDDIELRTEAVRTMADIAPTQLDPPSLKANSPMLDLFAKEIAPVDLDRVCLVAEAVEFFYDKQQQQQQEKQQQQPEKQQQRDLQRMRNLLACMANKLAPRDLAAWLQDARMRSILLRQLHCAVGECDRLQQQKQQKQQGQRQKQKQQQQTSPADEVLCEATASLLGVTITGRILLDRDQYTLAPNPALPVTDVGLWQAWEHLVRLAMQIRSWDCLMRGMLCVCGQTAMICMRSAIQRISSLHMPPPTRTMAAMASAVSTIGKAMAIHRRDRQAAYAAAAAVAARAIDRKKTNGKKKNKKTTADVELPLTPLMPFDEASFWDMLDTAIARWQKSCCSQKLNHGTSSALCALENAVSCARMLTSGDEMEKAAVVHRMVGCGRIDCDNLSGPADAGLVINRLQAKVCGGCSVLRYCSAECAALDWPRHQRACRRMMSAVMEMRMKRGAAGSC